MGLLKGLVFDFLHPLVHLGHVCTGHASGGTKKYAFEGPNVKNNYFFARVQCEKAYKFLINIGDFLKMIYFLIMLLFLCLLLWLDRTY